MRHVGDNYNAYMCTVSVQSKYTLFSYVSRHFCNIGFMCDKVVDKTSEMCSRFLVFLQHINVNMAGSVFSSTVFTIISGKQYN